VLCLALVALLLASVAHGRKHTHAKEEDQKAKGLRLIALYDGDKGTWMNDETIIQLSQQRIGFRDITDWVDSLAVPVPPTLPDQPQQKPYVRSLASQLQTTNLESTVTTLSSFFTRYYTTTSGVEAAEWIYTTLLAYSEGRKDIEVFFFNNTFPQPSVIARIVGTQSADTVILGSHEDSANLGGLLRAPGADDDASGVACSLEAFRVLVANNFKPNRTVEFQYYAAEEAGLLGSKAIAQSYAKKGVNVVGMMQLDMTMYPGQNNENVVGVVNDQVSHDLTGFVRQLVEAYTDIPWVNTLCNYGCSDHASWTQQGYRSSFPFESQFEQSNPYVHTSNDTLAQLNLNHGLQFARLGLGFIVELAATTYRPQLN